MKKEFDQMGTFEISTRVYQRAEFWTIEKFFEENEMPEIPALAGPITSDKI
ncbi:MAG: hypothetical protein OXC03_07115 [Flavobacteriaceae bacterium]|nr:hypothetical protein [Flavobacteriaceae bacterium]